MAEDKVQRGGADGEPAGPLLEPVDHRVHLQCALRQVDAWPVRLAGARGDRGRGRGDVPQDVQARQVLQRRFGRAGAGGAAEGGQRHQEEAREVQSVPAAHLRGVQPRPARAPLEPDVRGGRLRARTGRQPHFPQQAARPPRRGEDGPAAGAVRRCLPRVQLREDAGQDAGRLGGAHAGARPVEGDWHAHPQGRAHRRGAGASGRPHREVAGHADVAIREAFRRKTRSLVEEASPLPGHHRPVAEVSGQVDLPRADLRVRRDHEADPKGRDGVPYHGHHVAQDHDPGRGGPRDAQRRGHGHASRGPADGQRVPRRGREGTQRVSRHEEDGVPAVLFPVQRRASGDPVRGEGPAEDPAVHAQDLRGGEGDAVRGRQQHHGAVQRGGREGGSARAGGPARLQRGGGLARGGGGRDARGAEKDQRRGGGCLRGHGAVQVDPRVARSAGPVLQSDLLDEGVRAVYRREGRGGAEGVRGEVHGAAQRHRKPCARGAHQAGARHLGRAGHRRCARARRVWRHEGGRRQRHHRLQVAESAALLLRRWYHHGAHDQRAGLLRLRVPRQQRAPGGDPPHRSMLQDPHGGHPPQLGGGTRRPRGDRKDGDHQGFGQGVGQAVRGVQLLRRAGLPRHGQVL
mmetsp:Transcript_38454/g.64638  ORF Transcript_38454/g.64638 Transcript_38454/m.64638 type:complete len:630 (-) Transcript_38454:47-1936(-)